MPLKGQNDLYLTALKINTLYELQYVWKLLRVKARYNICIILPEVGQVVIFVRHAVINTRFVPFLLHLHYL